MARGCPRRNRSELWAATLLLDPAPSGRGAGTVASVRLSFFADAEALPSGRVCLPASRQRRPRWVSGYSMTGDCWGRFSTPSEAFCSLAPRPPVKQQTFLNFCQNFNKFAIFDGASQPPTPPGSLVETQSFCPHPLPIWEKRLGLRVASEAAPGTRNPPPSAGEGDGHQSLPGSPVTFRWPSRPSPTQPCICFRPFSPHPPLGLPRMGFGHLPPAGVSTPESPPESRWGTAPPCGRCRP